MKVDEVEYFIVNMLTYEILEGPMSYEDARTRILSNYRKLDALGQVAAMTKTNIEYAKFTYI